MADAQYNFEGIPDAPAGGYNFAGIPDVKMAASESDQPSSSALKLAGVRPAVSAATRIAAQVATSPNVEKAAEIAGRLTGGAVGLTTTGGLKGAVIGASKGAKLGSVVSAISDRVAIPTAKLLERIAPYAQTAATLSGVQGGLDLAQMADPKREDIGLLGIGHSSNGSAELRAPASQLRAVQYLIAKGASPSDAVKRVSGGVPQLMGPLMGLYMRSKLPK